MKNHKKNEAADFKIDLENSKRIFHGDDDDILWDIIINDIDDRFFNHKGVDLNNLPKLEEPFVNSERPDIYFMNDEFIIGIEHFQIDSSKKTRNGSQLIREGKRVHSLIDMKCSEYKEEAIYVEEPMEVRLSYENYVQTLINSFREHTSNILDYRENLKKIASDRKIFLAFYIEDITTLGNYIVTQKRIETLIPFCVKEFIDELMECDGLDYVIARVQNNYSYTFHIQQVNRKLISALYSECYDTTKEIFIPYKPVISSYINKS